MRDKHADMMRGARAVQGRKIGKFNIFCSVCGRRFTYPPTELMTHVKFHVQGSAQAAHDARKVAPQYW
jgi:hypothetical protein